MIIHHTTPQEIIKEFDKKFVVHCSDGDILGKDSKNEVRKAKSFLISTIIKQYKEMLEEVEGSNRAEKMMVNSFISPLESYRKEDQVYGYNLALSDLRLSLQSKIKEWKLIDNK